MEIGNWTKIVSKDSALHYCLVAYVKSRDYRCCDGIDYYRSITIHALQQSGDNITMSVEVDNNEPNGFAFFNVHT